MDFNYKTDATMAFSIPDLVFNEEDELTIIKLIKEGMENTIYAAKQKYIFSHVKWETIQRIDRKVYTCIIFSPSLKPKIPPAPENETFEEWKIRNGK